MPRRWGNQQRQQQRSAHGNRATRHTQAANGCKRNPEQLGLRSGRCSEQACNGMQLVRSGM
jgi:hypothetical protein